MEQDLIGDLDSKLIQAHAELDEQSFLSLLAFGKGYYKVQPARALDVMVKLAEQIWESDQYEKSSFLYRKALSEIAV